MEREFFISDLHFDHKNIIRYCNRPFSSVDEMNHFIVNTWNKTVDLGDTVYFLGDLCYGRGNRKIGYWIKKLNGNIVFIRGYHDRLSGVLFHDYLILNRANEKLMLIHNPRDAPADWDGWIVHGHAHNNQSEYPLVNKENKTINVSAELLDYKPISLGEMMKLIGKGDEKCGIG